MVNIDYTVFIQIVNFLVLIFVLNLILYKPIRRMLEERREKILGLETSINSSEQGVQEKDTLYTEGIKAARAEGMKKKEAIVEEASEKEREIIARINEKAKKNLEEIRASISKETESAKANLMQEVDDFAGQISQKLLGRSV